MWYLVAFVIFVLFLAFLRYLRFKRVCNLFKKESVCVFGLRGKGKDILMSNVVAYRKEPYISNVPYGGDYRPFDPSTLMVGGNTFENFASGNLVPYSYPYADGIDYYISDCGVYFPCQYNDLLNKKYKSIPLGLALLRHLGVCNFHFNVQSLNRVWDKMREQSENYVYCRGCKVYNFGLFKYVVQDVTLYDKYEGALAKACPFPIKVPLIGKEQRERIKLEKMRYTAQYGHITDLRLGYVLKSKYNTRHFKELLKNEEN